MPDAKTLGRITGYVIATSVALSVLAGVLGGLSLGLAAAVGGVFSILNWLAMRWLGRKLLVANDKGRAVWGTLLAAKMLVSLLAVWAILSTGVIDPIGFVVGLSGLVLGILAGTFHSALAAPPQGAEET